MKFTRLLATVVSILWLASACSISQERISVDAIARDASPVAKDRTIALLGATGMTGRYILREALAGGYRVRALTRSPQKLERLGRRIEIISGDARDPGTITRLLQGSDVVISAIGPDRSKSPDAELLSTTATGHIVNAMKSLGIRRYIVVSGAAVKLPGDRRSVRGWVMRLLVQLRYPGILRDKQAEYELLADSDIAWTLIRCPLIESAPYRKPALVSLSAPTRFTLRAGELAAFILGQIDGEEFYARGPYLGSQ